MEAIKQPKDYLELLTKLVLVEQKIVTAPFLLRRIPLDVFQTQNLLKQFLESNANVTANYYLLGPLKAELGKKHCAIVRGEELTNAKRRLAKIDICDIYSVQTNHTDCESLENVLKTNWFDQNVPALIKGFLKESEGPTAQIAISPILLAKDKDDRENEEDTKEAEENAETKKSTGKSSKRPILFTPISKEEEQREKEQVDFNKCNSKKDGDRLTGKEKSEKDVENSQPAVAHPPVKRPSAHPIKKEAKVAKTKTKENGGSKQTTIFSFFKK